MRLSAGLALLLAAAMVLALLAGPVWLGPGEVARALAGHGPALARAIVAEVRLPRVVLAALVGAILGLSGAVLQGLLRNPLAEPGLLGVSAGSALGAVIAIFYGLDAVSPLATPVVAIAGGFVTSGAAFALARRGGTLALILAGAAVSSLAMAGVSLALNLAPDPYAAYAITGWMLGSLEARSWVQVLLAAPFIAAGGALLFACRPALDRLALGERQAESLGVDLGRVRLLALAGTAFGVGGATAVTGAIGFVGLVAPHLVRPLVGHRPGAALVPAALAGAAMVVAADTVTRTFDVGGPPLGIGTVTALVGAPFFLWLVLRVARGER